MAFAVGWACIFCPPWTDMPGELAAFGINGGLKHGLAALLMTHPPLEQRIAALQQQP
jgi:Zn-dependent protease with chaperone function